jgi:uncharacterized protein (DUF1778 family)
MIKHAAELQGRTVTPFVVATVKEAAQRAMDEAVIIRLTEADHACVAQALLSPPQASPALKRGFETRRKLFRTD